MNPSPPQLEHSSYSTSVRTWPHSVDVGVVDIGLSPPTIAEVCASSMNLLSLRENLASSTHVGCDVVASGEGLLVEVNGSEFAGVAAVHVIRVGAVMESH